MLVIVLLGHDNFVCRWTVKLLVKEKRDNDNKATVETLKDIMVGGARRGDCLLLLLLLLLDFFEIDDVRKKVF